MKLSQVLLALLFSNLELICTILTVVDA